MVSTCLPTASPLRNGYTPHLQWAIGSADQLPYADEAFNLVFNCMMFSSILDDSLRGAIATEMWRVTKPGGLLLYDFAYDNPANHAVLGIHRREMRRLFPEAHLSFKRLTLAPPIARAITPLSPLLSNLLERLTVFNTHLLASGRKAT